MKFRYQLPDNWISVVSTMEEFANGGTQVSVRLRDKREFHGLLVSNSTYVVAARGHKDLPFALDEIDEIFQTDDDRNPLFEAVGSFGMIGQKARRGEVTRQA